MKNPIMQELKLQNWTCWFQMIFAIVDNNKKLYNECTTYNERTVSSIT